jgi:hypothetical protein
MRNLSCHTCQTKIVPYLHQQLSPRLQRRVALHLDGCPVCYAAYLSQRELSSELGAGLKRIGQPDMPQMQRMWSAIHADMQRPQRVSRRPVGRYGVVLLIFMLALLLPWSLDKQGVAHAIPNMPAPATTASVTETPLHVVMATPIASAKSTDAVIPAAQTPATPEGVSHP